MANPVLTATPSNGSTNAAIDQIIRVDVTDADGDLVTASLKVWLDGTLVYDGGAGGYQGTWGATEYALSGGVANGYSLQFVNDGNVYFNALEEHTVRVYAEDAAANVLDEEVTWRTRAEETHYVIACGAGSEPGGVYEQWCQDWWTAKTTSYTAWASDLQSNPIDINSDGHAAMIGANGKLFVGTPAGSWSQVFSNSAYKFRGVYVRGEDDIYLCGQINGPPHYGRVWHWDGATMSVFYDTSRNCIVNDVDGDEASYIAFIEYNSNPQLRVSDNLGGSWTNYDGYRNYCQALKVLRPGLVLWATIGDYYYSGGEIRKMKDGALSTVIASPSYRMLIYGFDAFDESTVAFSGREYTAWYPAIGAWRERTYVYKDGVRTRSLDYGGSTYGHNVQSCVRFDLADANIITVGFNHTSLYGWWRRSRDGGATFDHPTSINKVERRSVGSGAGPIMGMAYFSDASAPVLIPVTPEDGDTLVQTNQPAVLQLVVAVGSLQTPWTLEVDRGDGYETAIVYNGSVDFESSFSGLNSSVTAITGGFEISIDPSRPWPASSTITVKATATSAGGTVSPTTYAFTTAPANPFKVPMGGLYIDEIRGIQHS